MIEVTREYVGKHERWINDAGVEGLPKNESYNCWHEGCVKFPGLEPKKTSWDFLKTKVRVPGSTLAYTIQDLLFLGGLGAFLLFVVGGPVFAAV